MIFEEICIMKFSSHEIFLFLLKLQRILNKHLQSPIMFHMLVCPAS
jgi:hypothetical protein